MNTRVPHGPDGWQMAIGAYALSQGVALLMEPALYRGLPSFAFLSHQPVPLPVWGAILVCYAVASGVCLFFGTPTKRASLGVIGTMLWLFLGVEMLWSSAFSGFWSPGGAFEFLIGLGCMVATVQWGREL